jgi:hypothetical protein
MKKHKKDILDLFGRFVFVSSFFFLFVLELLGNGGW